MDEEIKEKTDGDTYKIEYDSTRDQNTRARILRTAETFVMGDRNVQYGDPSDDFKRTANLWQIYLDGLASKEDGTLKLVPHDVAIMMILLKVSRIAWSPEVEDHWIDIAGYAACGADCLRL